MLMLKSPHVLDLKIKRPTLSNFEAQEWSITTCEIFWELHYNKQCSLYLLEYSYWSRSLAGREIFFSLFH